MLTGGKAVIEALLVVDREGWGLFVLERAQTDKFTTLPFQLHALGHHLAHRQARAYFVEK